MTTLEMWSVLVGALLPPLVAVVQQPKWSAPVRAIVTFLLCAAAGAGTAFFNGELTGKPVASAILLVFVSALATFKGFWKQTGLTDAIERATSPVVEGEVVSSREVGPRSPYLP